MQSVIVAFVFMTILVAVFILTYVGNKKTPVPEGCENLKAECGGCHDISCGNHPAHKE